MGLQDIPRPVKTYHTKPYEGLTSKISKSNGKGKTILITGGATGVGYAISKAFAQTGVARIVIFSRSSGPQAEAKKALNADYPGVEVLTFQAASTDRKAVDEVLKSVGTIDVLVLCAATSPAHVRALDLPVEEVENTIATNVMGNFNILRSYLLSAGAHAKTVIHVSSAASHLILPNQVGYGPSKGAFQQMIAAMALEHSPEKDNVRLFNYHPGAFLTPMARKVGYDEESAFEWEDIQIAGDFAVWLASEEATFLHGRFVWAQWDVDELLALKEKIEENPSLLTLGLMM